MKKTIPHKLVLRRLTLVDLSNVAGGGGKPTLTKTLPPNTSKASINERCPSIDIKC